MVVSLLALVLMLSKKLKNKVIKKAYRTKDAYFFNGFVKSMEISYIQQVLTSVLQLKLFIGGSKHVDKNSVYIAIGLIIFTFLLPVWSANVLSSNRWKLDKGPTRRKYQNMYPDIHLTRNNWTIYYWPISILRKWIFVMLPLIFNKPTFQI